MRSTLRSWRPQIVHAQDRRSGLVTAGLHRRASGPPVVLQTYHGVPDDVDQSWFTGVRRARPPSVYSKAVLTADAAVARSVTRTIVPSLVMGDFLHSRLHVPRNKLVHIDNGVTLPRANPPTGPIRRLLFVGLLIPRKGLLDLLDALRQPGVMPADATLDVVGDGPLRDEAEAVARQDPLAGRVRFLGYRTDIVDLVTHYDALVLPSRLEQQPLVVAQAMGAGKPVLATRTGGVPEMLEMPGLPDFLAQPGHVDGLASALTRLFGYPDPGGLGKQLAIRARAHYSAVASADAHLDLYRKLLV